MTPLLQGRMARLPSHPSGPPRTASRNTTPHGSPQHHPARLPATPPRTAPRNATPHGFPQFHPARLPATPPRTAPRTAPSAQQGKAPRHHARKPLGLLPGRFYQKTILLMNGVWWAYGMKAREGSGSVIIREARFPGVIEPRVSSTPMA